MIESSPESDLRIRSFSGKVRKFDIWDKGDIRVDNPIDFDSPDSSEPSEPMRWAAHSRWEDIAGASSQHGNWGLLLNICLHHFWLPCW